MGKVIKQERLFQGLPLKFVAELINISEAALKSYEDGKRLVGLDVIYKLSQIYDVSIEELIANKILNGGLSNEKNYKFIRNKIKIAQIQAVGSSVL